jgi:hypothetical protein
MAVVCCGNYYLCQVKHRCDDERECHALTRAVVGPGEDWFRRCSVVPDSGGFHYEFETLPTLDLRGAVRRMKKEEAKPK